jgi:WD40 repeat protein
MSAAFSPDGARAVTASKDGSLCVWNTAVRYQLQEDPKTLLKIDLPLPAGQVFEQLAWGPDGTVAASLGGHIHFLDSKTGQVGAVCGVQCVGLRRCVPTCVMGCFGRRAGQGSCVHSTGSKTEQVGRYRDTDHRP